MLTYIDERMKTFLFYLITYPFYYIKVDILRHGFIIPALTVRGGKKDKITTGEISDQSETMWGEFLF